MSKAELKKILSAYRDLDAGASAPIRSALALIDALPAPRQWPDVKLAQPDEHVSPPVDTALLENLKRLDAFLSIVGARKAAHASLRAFTTLLDRHRTLDIDVLVERATSEARRRSSRGKSSGRNMSKEPESASALAERLGDFTQPTAEAEKLLDQLASRATSKAYVMDVAKQLMGRSFATKKDAVEALKRWRWQWAHTRSVSKAIASGA